MFLLSKTFIVWLAATYVLVLVSVGVDFVSGVRKARLAGQPRHSSGYKRTCDKAVKYFLPMLCLSCIDFIASVFFAAPFLTMTMGAFNIFCEWRSVMETVSDKREIRRAAQTMRLVIENRDDLAAAIARLVTEMAADGDGSEEGGVGHETH